MQNHGPLEKIVCPLWFENDPLLTKPGGALAPTWGKSREVPLCCVWFACYEGNCVPELRNICNCSRILVCLCCHGVIHIIVLLMHFTTYSRLYYYGMFIYWHNTRDTNGILEIDILIFGNNDLNCYNAFIVGLYLI